MITQNGLNVEVCAIHGDFDAVQSLVKDIFNDSKFNKNFLINTKFYCLQQTQLTGEGLFHKLFTILMPTLI